MHRNICSICTWQNLSFLLAQSSITLPSMHHLPGSCLVSTCWSCDRSDDVVIEEMRDWGSSVSKHQADTQARQKVHCPPELLASASLKTQASPVVALWYFPLNNWSQIDSNEPILGFTFFLLLPFFSISTPQPNQIVVCYLQSPLLPFDIAFCHLKGYRDQF